MNRILVLGAGKVGSLVATLLTRARDYEVYLADKESHQALPLGVIALDAADPNSIKKFVTENSIKTLVSCLPYYCNIPLIRLAKECELNYFDLTEDVATATEAIKVSEDAKTVFVPQCGLAPGFVSIAAQEMMRFFAKLNTVKMRVGALPLNISNALQYSLTWSTDGLINQYSNPCYGLKNGELIQLLPLDDREEIKIDGLTYEAFNTSGGIGTLAETYRGKVKQLNYKTIRYPGHRDKMRFLLNDLQLSEERETLKRILENVLPKTLQDVVVIYISVTGNYAQNTKEIFEKNYVKKLYSKEIDGVLWSALQLATASSCCAVLDLVLSSPDKYHGLVRQEEFLLEQIITNRFGAYYV